MAYHKSSEKRIRQTIKKTERNRFIRATVRTFIKKVRYAIEANDKDKVKENLPKMISRLDWAVTKGVLHRKTASRLISRITLHANKLLKSE